MTAKVRCWCQHCQKELPPSHTGPCPHCGKTGKNCKVEMRATVGIKSTLSAIHEAHFSDRSFNILSILLTLFFGLWGLIWIGVYELIPLPTWLKNVLPVFIVFLATALRSNQRVNIRTRYLCHQTINSKKKTIKTGKTFFNHVGSGISS